MAIDHPITFHFLPWGREESFPQSVSSMGRLNYIHAGVLLQPYRCVYHLCEVHTVYYVISTCVYIAVTHTCVCLCVCAMHDRVVMF